MLRNFETILSCLPQKKSWTTAFRAFKWELSQVSPPKSMVLIHPNAKGNKYIECRSRCDFNASVNFTQAIRLGEETDRHKKNASTGTITALWSCCCTRYRRAEHREPACFETKRQWLESLPLKYRTRIATSSLNFDNGESFRFHVIFDNSAPKG